MGIEALKFDTGIRGTPPSQVHLKIESSRDLLTEKKGALPLAYVTRIRSLPKLLKFKDVVEDRGSKHEAIGLARILIGRKKIPLINGKFKSDGQLKRSVNQLIKNAIAKGERNLYIIGVEDVHFNKVWHMAGKFHHEGKKSSFVGRKRKIIAQKPSFDDGSPGGSLMDIISPLKTPAELSQNFIGESREAELIRQLILRAAEIDEPVLVLGATGTGKEIVARQIHLNSGRGNRAFIPVNCGGIADGLFESELFGHEKGAFTGANAKRHGLWRVADGGTLFLDEVGDLTLDQQVKILRALQEGTTRPVGGDKEMNVSARIIAATNRDLFSMVQAGQFREDLYYRLRGFLIFTPPLKDHPEDIPLLTEYLWDRVTRGANLDLPDEIIEELQSYRWPGNVRELKMVLSNLFGLFHGEKRLRIEHLQAVFQLQCQVITRKSDGKSRKKGKEPFDAMENLLHLSRTMDAVQAAKLDLKPLVNGSKKDEDTVHSISSKLRYRIDEIDTLIRNSERYSPSAFECISGLRAKIFYFLNLIKTSVPEAVDYWRENALEEFDLVRSTIENEMKRLREGA